MAGRIAAGRGLAITYKMQVQQPTKTFCNFMQKRLAKNTVSGMLLYAKTEEKIQPDNVYQMHGSQISVKTLDLNLPFVDIAAQMDRIVESHFTGVIKAD